MGVSSAYCENLPQMPGRSSLVLFLACSFTSSETNTILREFSVHLTFQAKDPDRNLLSGERTMHSRKSAELLLCVWCRWESIWTQDEKLLPWTPIHHQKNPVQALLSPVTNPINPASVFGNYKFHSPPNFQNFIGLTENPWRTMRQKFFTAVVQKMW